MSESILRALMQLFAIVASVQGISASGRDIVRSFLRLQLNQEQVVSYLRLFDQYLEEILSSAKSSRSEKRLSVSSVKILRICTQINAELNQSQKLVVLVRLLEFIHSDFEILHEELDFVKTVGDTFNFSQDDFDELFHFVTSEFKAVKDSPRLLLVTSSPPPEFKEAKILPIPVDGELHFCWQKAHGVLLMRHQCGSEIFLNGQLTSRSKVYFLSSGAALRGPRIGTLYFSDLQSTFLANEDSSKLQFEVNDLSLVFPGGKQAIHPLSFAEESGRMVAIMGGSGAGKSTLLSILNGTQKPDNGQVLINGINLHADNPAMKGVIGYVSQDDLLLEDLSVFDNLYYNGKLCLSQLTEQELKTRIEELLQAIGLWEVRKLKVGNPLDKTLSGGQRKRLNIGLELLREPPVLFVDEPTSGLSSRDSEMIMDLLKEVALRGKLVFVVIHQPSSEIFKLFDRLLILDQGGFLIYDGNPVDALVYFKTIVNHVNATESACLHCGHVNPEQIFNIIENKVVDEYGRETPTRRISPAEWHDFFQDQQKQETLKTQQLNHNWKNQFHAPNWFGQWSVFSLRDVYSKWQNKPYIWLNVLEAPLLALLLAGLFRYQPSGEDYHFGTNTNIPAFFFVSVLVAFFMGLMVSAEEILKDRKILKRERFLHLSQPAYLFSKLGILAGISAFQTGLFVLISHAILEIPGSYLSSWWVMFSTAVVANLIGLNLSAGLKSAVTVYILIPFLIIPQMILSGAIIRFDELNPSFSGKSAVPVVGDMMVSRWSFEALMTHQFRENDYEQSLFPIQRLLAEAGYKKSAWLPKVEELANSKNPEEQLLAIRTLTQEALALGLPIDTEKLKNQPTYRTAILEQVGTKYRKLYQQQLKLKDEKINTLSVKLGGSEALGQLRKEQVNQKLQEMMTFSLTPLIFEEGELIRLKDRAYIDPFQQNALNASFLVVDKRIGSAILSTYAFNLLIIWLMSTLLFLSLLLDLPARLGHVLSKKKN